MKTTPESALCVEMDVEFCIEWAADVKEFGVVSVWHMLGSLMN